MTRVPGWKITAHGFQANASVSDEFVFPSPLADWKPTSTTAGSLTVSVAGEPSSLKFDLSSPGFSLFFQKGMDLQLGTIGSPILSWTEGSVEESVSTPTVSWVLVSFRQGQPPVLFSFVEAPHAMIIDGEPGKWHLRTIGDVNGWVRVLLPFGLDSRSALTAGSLGDLVKKITDQGDTWTGDTPKLLDTKLTADATSVTINWLFDKPGALVPQAAVLAGFGGYPLRVLTKTAQLEGSSEEGPITITREATLSIRFPVVSWPGCRYVASPGETVASAGGALDVTGAAELATNALSADFSREANTAAGASLMAFLSHAHGDLEPYSGERLPYLASGGGYDVAAAHGLLTQALAVSNGSTTLQNPLLDELFARVDAYTWQPWGMDEDVWRRASSLASIAFSMRADPQSRMQAAMLQAGLSAERGLDLWHYWRGDLTQLPKHLEAMENLRRRVFALQGLSTADAAVDELFSPLRYCGSGQVQVSGQALRWMSVDGSPGTMELIAPAGTKFAASDNLKSVSLVGKGGALMLNYVPKGAGICAVQFSLPASSSIPTQVAHSYVEVSR